MPNKNHLYQYLRCTAFIGTAIIFAAPTAIFAKQLTPELQVLDDALPGDLINDPTSLAWDSFGSILQSETVTGSSIPGGQAAIKFTINKMGAKPYDAGANVPITAAIKKNDDVVIAFYARTISAQTKDGQGIVTVRFQQNAAPYDGFGETKQIIGKEWRLYEISAKSTMNIAKGDAVVGFQLAGAEQIIEIGQTIILSGTKTAMPETGPRPQSATTALLPQLEGKGVLITNSANKAWSIFGNGAKHMMVPSPNIPGTGGMAFQMTTMEKAANIYDIGAIVPIEQHIKEDDILTIAILARTTPNNGEATPGKLGIRVQINEAPYAGFADNMIDISSNWRLLQIRTRANMDIPAGKGALALHFGAQKQSIEIGQVFILNSGPQIGE
ncbi:hypothetical protein LPB140_05380 [Sphingorhabdus lutea]|uniref:CBM-cenC domain-containing protein n=1 Tax=Sphingorhabdus lutea TaxID=1913578 RepID=A0A1L3JB12_9SPHN|nr:hypothetical protein [Sphingorhabdus lutea]APG62325.1 hypothetical protein LPB140_05380 [Sphingorhabdus lutea]